MTDHSLSTVIDSIDQLARENGYRRRGRRWIRHAQGVIHVLQLYHDRYRPSVFLDFGVYVPPTADGVVMPRPAECQIHGRATDLFGGAFGSDDPAFDLSSAMASEERSSRVSAVAARTIAFLGTLSDYHAIVTAVQGELPAGLLVTKELRERVADSDLPPGTGSRTS